MAPCGGLEPPYSTYVVNDRLEGGDDNRAIGEPGGTRTHDVV